MFTGIIQEIGKITSSHNVSGKKYFVIACKSIQNDLIIGESVACNGICLTVTDFTSTNIVVEIMHATAKITTANNWQINTLLHLEKAVAASGRLNGHIVQGHIDTIMILINRFYIDKTLYLEFENSTKKQKLPEYIIDKGSICVDGVSLTVANINRCSFQVALISHTLTETNLGKIKIGNAVNIEFDVIGKYLHNTDKVNTKITQDWLTEVGFI